MINSLKDILWAKSIAVVGATRNEGKKGYEILWNIINGGYKGEIFPVNKKETSILGLKCYSSLLDINKDIDLVVIIVPAMAVKQIIIEASKKNVKGAIIISGGFKEIGNENLENELFDIAQKLGIRLIGPNCQGINYRANHLCATWPLIDCDGKIGIVSQSGTIGAAIAQWAKDEKVGISCFASLGNKVDIDEIDFINFFSHDIATQAISVNIEGVKNGERFIDILSSAAKKKPIIILKPGRTEAGVKAVSSHTKSIAGNDMVFSAFCKRHGIIRANDITEFYDYSKIASLCRKPNGNDIVIITSSGGAGIIAVDTAIQCGLNVASINDMLVKELSTVLPSQCVISNPLDLTGDANIERYEMALEKVISFSKADIILIIFGDPIIGAYELVKKYSLNSKKTIVASYIGGGDIEKQEVEKMNKNSIPVFPTPERAIKSINSLFSLKI